MTDDEILQAVKTLTGSANETELNVYISLAESSVIGRLFPFNQNATWADVPEKHHMRTCEIAAYLYNKRGAEGEVSHSESGVSRTYESASVPASMFAGMVPFAGIPVTASDDNA